MARIEKRGRLAASLLMLFATVAPIAAPATAQALDAQQAALADAAMEQADADEGVGGQSVSAGDRGDRGDSFYCGERRLGQWFYCERPKAEVAKPKAAPAPSQSAAERMKAIAAQLDELKARAILEPSEENVIAYVRFQREQLDRASTFSDTWQRALWQNPDIDYTLQRPVSTVGKRAWTDNRTADRDRVLANLGQRYGMFYFFAQSCAACEVFSPILRSVADSHRITVMAVSTDGGPSRQFPNYVVDSGQRKRMGVPLATPALVLFDTATRKTVPIGFGVMSADEIMDRIFMLTNTKVGSDY
ncbi:MAG: conjugal transfer protein TraF [Rhizorhabdus sp.]